MVGVRNMLSSTRQKELLRIVAALTAGFVGGQFHSGSLSTSAASGDTFRARRFELTDDTGRVLAYWGSNAGVGPSLHFLDPNGDELITLGLQGKVPLLNLAGPDSRIRATLRLEGDDLRPILGMGDDNWEGRLLLGALPSELSPPSSREWGLILRGPLSRARVVSVVAVRGVAEERVWGRIAVLDQRGAAATLPRSPARSGR